MSSALPGSDSFNDFLVTALVDAGTVPDLLVANTGAGNVSVFLGDGDGGFAAQPVVPIGTFTNGIATGDVNGDGELDLVATHLGGFGALNGGVRLALGNGNGTFQASQLLRGSVAADSVVVADFDDDEDADVAYVLEGPQFDWDVEVMLGNGNGTFAAAVALGLGYDLIHSLRTADFDQDGVPDLAVSLEGTQAALLRGKGNGGFDTPVLLDTGGGATLPADLDLDSFPDLVTSSEVGVTAVVMNVSDEQGGLFAPETTITNGEPLYFTTKPKHRLKLRFTSDEPGSTYECRLKQLKPVRDSGAWEPCTSPYRRKVVPGRYQFSVRATDLASNVDPTAAKLSFKVKAQ